MMDLSSFSGTGFQYLQNQLLQYSTTTLTKNNKNSNYDGANDRPNRLSESAKHILIHLLQQENIQLKSYRCNNRTPATTTTTTTTANLIKTEDGGRISGVMSLSTTQGSKSNRKVIDPNSMTDEDILDLAYKNETSLFGSMLFVIDEYIQKEGRTAITSSSTTTTIRIPVATKYILQKCMLTVPPHHTPGLLSARDMILMALHFLCQEYTPSDTIGCTVNVSSSKDDALSPRPILLLPLLYSVSNFGDLERRSYIKALDWDLPTILPQLLVLEQDFYRAIVWNGSWTGATGAATTTNSNSTSGDDDVTDDTNTGYTYYHWLPRAKFLPSVTLDDNTRRQVLVHGLANDVPENTTNNNHNIKPKAKARTTTPSKSIRNTASSKSKQIPLKRRSSKQEQQPQLSTSIATKPQHDGDGTTSEDEVGGGSSHKKHKTMMQLLPTDG
jgi:hypothetical protein